MKTKIYKFLLKLSILFIFTVFNVCAYAQMTDTYSTPGSYNWTCPSWVTSITVECWGAGGGGGAGFTGNGDGGSGGGGGAYTTRASISVAAGSSYTIVVGAGGTKGLYAGTGIGATGGSSTATFGAVVLTAGGGNGGVKGTGGAVAGAAGGTASGGTSNFSGGNGGNGSGTNSGAGGGGAGSGGVGGNATTITAGTGTAVGGGNGGAGSTGNSVVGIAGSNYGGGGSAGTKVVDGGDGAGGQIKITYPCPTFSFTSNTTATTPITAGGTSTVTVTGSAASLPTGSYTVTYNLSAPNAATGLTAAMTVSVAGSGTFTTAALANAGTTTLTITDLTLGSCTNTLSARNTASIVVNAAASYCTPAPTSVDGTGITRVVMGSIDNATGDEAGHYGDYSAMSTTVVQGATVNCNITFSTSTYDYNTKIWVDWNNDGDFADAGEEVYSGLSGTTSPNTLAASFSVPAGASIGNHRLRIGGCDSSTPIPCYTGSYGSYEDYTINVAAAGPMTFTSCTTTQPNTTNVSTGTTANEVICIQIVTAGTTGPLSVTSFTVNANGTTAIADINAANSAKIYYTGTSSTFSTATLFGQNTPTIANFNITGTQTLASGTNYFWLTYDVKGTATAGNVIDGECTSLTVSSARTPTATAPAGNRVIVNQVTIGTGGGTGVYPFYINYNWSRSASLYTAAEVGNPTIITQLAWNISTASTASVPIKIYLKTTTETTLTAGTWNDMVAGATLVYDNTVSFTPTGWKTINITDFTYCSDNLLVLCEQNITAYVTSANFYYTSAASKLEYWNSDAAPPTTATGTISANRPDIRIDKSAAALCSGAPTPGSAAATPTTVCVGASSALSVTGSSTGCGFTYQWQSSSDNVTFNNITGATSQDYTAYPTANTYYRRVITCGANSANSVSVLVSVNGPTYAAIPYTESFETWASRCDTREIPTVNWAGFPFEGNNSWRRDDQGVADALWSNASGAYTPLFTDGARSARFHSYSTSSSGTLDLYINLSTQIGTKVLMFDYINTSGTDNLAIQISTDGGLTFATLQTYTTAATWTTYSIDVASNSATCVIRFRATGDSGSTDIGLDNVVIVGPCSGVPTAGTASLNSTSFCASTAPILTLTGYTLAGGITLQWQSSVDGTSWTDIAGGTTDVFVAPTVYQTTYYRCVVRCIADITNSNTVTLTNTAQSITSIIASPVNVACGATTSLTATASGGATVKWYNVATGGTALGTGSPWTTPANNVNTTYYATANSGSASEYGGMPSATGTLTSTSLNYGVAFNVTQALTLTSCQVYVPKKSKVKIIIECINSASAVMGTTAEVTITGANALQTVNLGWALPIGTGYKLRLKSYTTVSGADALLYSTATSYPYPTPSGSLVVTSGWTGSTTSTNYHFYNLCVTTACESMPRNPVNVVVTGVAVPTASTYVSPANGAAGVCPVSTILTWNASTTACAAATGYKLYVGTNNPPSNYINGTNVGNVLTYNIGDIPAGTYYWRVIPTNSAGDATGFATWSFTTAANPGNICNTLLGTGVTSTTLPISVNNSTTQGTVNDLTSANLVTCGNTSYFGGEDAVWSFTPATSGTISIALTSAGSYTGLALYEGCPLSASVCGAPAGYCVATSQSSTGSKTMSACVNAGTTYYLLLDSWPSPDYNAYSKLTVSSPTGTTTPANDLPCNAIALTLGAITSGDNSCAGSASEPTKPTCWTSGVQNTIWYTIVAPTSGQLVIKTVTGTLTDTQIGLYSGACGTLVAVSGACNNDLSGCGSSLSSQLSLSGLTPGNTYYLAIDGAYDLQGNFTVQAIDPVTMTLPVTPGQDCAATLPTCNTVIDVPNPGYANTGTVCDFSGTGNCTGGERASVWYTINILSAGTLMFDIIPNDYSGGSAGDETDYDFLVWKTGGSGTITDCSTIASNSAQGLVACNYSYLGVTGLYTGGAGNPAVGGSIWDASYEAPITVAAGDQYLICVSNYTLSTSGFNLDYVSSGGTATINTNAVPTTLQWTGTNTTAWTTQANWGGCTIPACAINTYIYTGPTRWPIVSTANESVKDLALDATGQLTINATCTLTVCGNFTNAGTINVNGVLEVKGHFANTGTINFGASGKLIFSGAASQSFTSSSNLTVPNVVIANTSGGISGVVMSSGKINVSGALTFTSGIVTTSASSLIVMRDGATYTGASNTSFISGPMQKIGDDAFIFPIGKGSKLAQLGIADPGATATDAFTAEYFASGAPSNATTLFSTLDHHCSYIEYWNITKDVGSHYPAVSLYWNDGAYSGITDLSTFDLHVAHYNGSAWEDKGGVVSGNTTSGYITSNIVFTSYSPLSFASKNLMNPLPVELISFDGKNRGSVNLLNWETATETNNDYFSVEKSQDGIAFETLSKVKGAGNSNIKLSYIVSDQNPYKNLTYYRLKQNDFNGKVSYSKTISIATSSIFDKSDVRFTPNPFTNEVNIKMINMNSSEASLLVMDLLGNKYLEKKIAITDFNTDDVSIDLSELPKGMYFVLFKANDYTKFEKMIKN